MGNFLIFYDLKVNWNQIERYVKRVIGSSDKNGHNLYAYLWTLTMCIRYDPLLILFPLISQVSSVGWGVNAQIHL
jgi:hypothetical protein